MSNKTKRRATDWENDVTEFLRTHGFPDAVRTESASPLGDHAGIGDWTIESKSGATTKFSDWLTQVKNAAERRGLPKCKGLIFWKRPQKSTGQGFVIQTIEDWCEEHGVENV